MKRWYRSKELVLVSVLFGVLLPAFGIGGTLQGTDSGIRRVLGISIQLVIAYVLLFRFARMGVRVGRAEVIIRNPFRSIHLAWDRILRFELRSTRFLGETAYVQLRDETGIRIWGIFPPNRALRPANRDAERLIDELNGYLREARARRD